MGLLVSCFSLGLLLGLILGLANGGDDPNWPGAFGMLLFLVSAAVGITLMCVGK